MNEKSTAQFLPPSSPRTADLDTDLRHLEQAIQGETRLDPNDPGHRAVMAAQVVLIRQRWAAGVYGQPPEVANCEPDE